MKDGLRIIGVIIVAILVGGILTFIGNGIATGNYAFWAPKQAVVERKVFEGSPSYIEGFNSSLAADYQQYTTAPDSQKVVMKNIILVKYTKYKSSDIGDDGLRQWFITLRGF